MKGSPVDPDRIYVSQTSGWFGQLLQASTPTEAKLGSSPASRLPMDHPLFPRKRRIALCMTHPPKPASLSPRTSGTTAPSIHGNSSASGILSRRSPTPKPSTPALKMRPSSAPPTAAKAGTNCPACAATAPDPTGSQAQAACASTRSFSTLQNPDRIYIAISAAGAFRTDDGGKTWKPINKGLESQYIPDPHAEVGHCVHHIALHPSLPDVLFMQKHWDVMRSNDAGDNWTKISGNLPTDFGFVIDVHAHEPETVYVVPIKSDSEHFPLEGKLQVFPQPCRGQ